MTGDHADVNDSLLGGHATADIVAVVISTCQAATDCVSLSCSAQMCVAQPHAAAAASRITHVPSPSHIRAANGMRQPYIATHTALPLLLLLYQVITACLLVVLLYAVI